MPPVKIGKFGSRAESNQLPFALSLSVAGVLVIFITFLCGRFGLHVDEINYLNLATHQRLGDSDVTGKPVAFYFFNFAILRSLGFLLGPYRYLSIYFVYTLVNVGGIVFLTLKLGLSRPRQVLFFCLLLLSPFLLFTASHLMMETAMPGLLALTMAMLVQGGRAPKWVEGLGAFSAIVAMCFKETALLAVLILLIAYLPKRDRRAGLLALAIVVFEIVRKLEIACLHLPKVVNLASIAELTSSVFLRQRLAFTSDYFVAWLFCLGPVVLVAAVWCFWKTRAVRGAGELPVSLALLSGGGVLFIQIVSTQEFFRYATPVVWIGAVALAAYVAAHFPPRAGVWVAFFLFLPTLNLGSVRPAPLSLWPGLMEREMTGNAYTILSSVPVWRWYLLSADQRSHLCLWLDENASEHPYLLHRFFLMMSPDVRFFDESSKSQFASCSGGKVVLRGDCAVPCGSPDYRYTTCTPITYQAHIATPRSFDSQSCLP